MKKIILLMFICVSFLCGCNSSEDINAKNAVIDYYKSIFVVVPDECVEFKEYSNGRYEYSVYYNPAELNPEDCEGEDVSEYIVVNNKTLYVEKNDDVYTVFDINENEVHLYFPH